MASYEYLLNITRGRLYENTPGVMAATPWGFSLYLSKYQISVLRQCCPQLQEGVVAAKRPFFEGNMECRACGHNTSSLSDNKHMLLWRNLDYDVLELWLQEAGVSPLEQVLIQEEFAEDLRSWLRRRSGHSVPRHYSFYEV